MVEQGEHPHWVTNPASPGDQAKTEAYIEEHVLAPVQRDQSRVREKNYRQEVIDEELMTKFLDERGRRLAPTPEQKEQLDRQLMLLGKLFEGTDIYWKIDGALNISLYRGEYIGMHKDIDIATRPEDIEKLEAHLAQHGYGFFVSEGRSVDDPHGSMEFQRVGAKDFRDSELHHLVMAIDEHGRIRPDAELNFIDLHLPPRDAQGRELGYYDIPLLEEWNTPRPVNWHGQMLNLSHPAYVAYYKLHSTVEGRQYDLTDVAKLVESPAWSSKEFDTLSELFATEQQFRYREASQYVDRVYAEILPSMTLAEMENEFLSDFAIGRAQIFRSMTSDQIRLLARVVQKALPQGEGEVKRAIIDTILSYDQNSPQARLEKLRLAFEHHHPGPKQ